MDITLESFDTALFDLIAISGAVAIIVTAIIFAVLRSSVAISVLIIGVVSAMVFGTVVLCLSAVGRANHMVGQEQMLQDEMSEELGATIALESGIGFKLLAVDTEEGTLSEPFVISYAAKGEPQRATLVARFRELSGHGHSFELFIESSTVTGLGKLNSEALLGTAAER